MIRAARIVFPLAVALAACGEGPKSDSVSLGSRVAPTSGVEIAGTFAAKTPDFGRLLVFAYANVPPDAAPAELEPASVSAIGPNRDFALSSVPPGNVTILVFADKGSDGAIDPGDPIAILDDPSHQLTALQAGDGVVITDLAFDAAHGKATAGAIEVRRAAAQTSPATQTQ